jgi:3-dehydroquinate synthase
MTQLAPGSYRTCVERRGRFDDLLHTLEGPCFALADERVLRLHPHVARALKRLPHLALKAGEGAKTLRTVERLALAAAAVPRQATVLAIGGGTIGDVATVFAHLHKRGARLVHVPTTWLAAVDSSVGGKGAVNVGVGQERARRLSFPRRGLAVWRALHHPVQGAAAGGRGRGVQDGSDARRAHLAHLAAGAAR